MRKLAATLGLIAVYGCTMPAPAPDADYGAPPTNYKAKIKNYYETRLKDAESARYKFGRPQRAYSNEVPIRGGALVWYGWMVPVDINAKNSFGAYVGYEPHYVAFKGQKISGDANLNIERITWVGEPLSEQAAEQLNNKTVGH